jgi:hypothetical protein
MPKAEQCAVWTSRQGAAHERCDAPATIKCFGTWFCAEHYDAFHEDGRCLHVPPDEFEPKNP